MSVQFDPRIGSYTGLDEPVDEVKVYPNLGESLGDLARKFGVDRDELALANPQINSPDQPLSPGQEIHVPKDLKPQLPFHADSTPASQAPKASLPPRPPGASEDANGMKTKIMQAWENAVGKEAAHMASYPDANAQHSIDENEKQASIPGADAQHSIDENAKQASIPETNSPAWQEQQAKLDASARSAAAQEAQKNQVLAANRKLTDLGLPPDPPEISTEDVMQMQLPAKLVEPGKAGINGMGLVKDGFNETVVQISKDMAEHLAEHAIGPGAAEVALRAGAAAESIEMTSGIFTIVGMANFAIEKAEAFKENKFDRKLAISSMQGDMKNMALELVQQKFPQMRNLNERGMALMKASHENFNQRTSAQMDPILELAQFGLKGDGTDSATDIFLSSTGVGPSAESRQEAIDHAGKQLSDVILKETTQLANEDLQIMYDPGNWQE